MKNKIYLCAALLLTQPVFADEDSADEKIVTIATVNGVAITLPEIEHYMSVRTEAINPDQALSEIINAELLQQAAKDDGVLNDPQLMLTIKRTTSGLIAQHYLQKRISELVISEQDMLDRYNRDYADSDQYTEYNANHILLETEAVAKEIINKLDKGAVFSDLAKMFSTGPSGKNGGALGWFVIDTMVPEFSQATRQLKPGQYSSSPVKTQFGWHVILLNETRSNAAPSFESVQEDISSDLAAEGFQSIMKSLYSKANIQMIQPE